MCHFGRSRLFNLCIQLKIMSVSSHGVPPFGNLRVAVFSDSPELIAGLHVLLRLSMPRHPPTALNSLITYHFSLLIWAFWTTSVIHDFFRQCYKTFEFSSANFHQWIVLQQMNKTFAHSALIVLLLVAFIFEMCTWFSSHTRYFFLTLFDFQDSLAIQSLD